MGFCLAEVLQLCFQHEKNIAKQASSEAVNHIRTTAEKQIVGLPFHKFWTASYWHFNA